MPTFLTNAKMSPALRARIEASVSGGRRVRGPSSRRPGLTAIVRIAFFVVLALLVYVVLAVKRPDPQRFGTGGAIPASNAAMSSAPK